MGQGIFDWDDEEEKKQEEWRESSQPPAEYVPYQADRTPEVPQWTAPWEQPGVTEHEWQEAVNSWDQQPIEQEPIEYIPYQPESADETIRKGGLAWSAGIVFFSSIVFMLFVGWVVDWVFQSSPWGIVGGIVLGSILGFVQFFRISSQIFDSKKADSSFRPLMPRDDDDR